jgi:mRNA interferase MazF
MATLPTPGDVVLLPHQGVQQLKIRPFVVVSSAIYHATRPDLVLGVVTSRLPGTPGPTEYVLQDWQAAGLRYPSLFRPYFVTVPITNVPLPIGRLFSRDWAEVQARLRLAIAV